MQDENTSKDEVLVDAPPTEAPETANLEESPGGVDPGKTPQPTEGAEPPVEVVKKDQAAAPVQLFIACSDPTTIAKLTDEFTEFNNDDAETRGTMTHRIMNTVSSPVSNMAAQTIQKHILDKEGTTLREELLLKNTTWKCGSTVSGKQAVMAFTARNRGHYRLRLYNSGFYIDLRPLSIGRLNSLMESVDFEGQRLGRIVGNFQYMVFSAVLKEAVLKLIPEIVTDSNLKNWDAGNTLVNNISFNDYDPIIWAISAMLSDRKLTVGAECVECNASFDVVYDYGKFHLILDIPSKALELISMDTEVVDKAWLKEYRKHLHAGLDLDLSWQTTRMELEEPSLPDWVSNANALLAKIETVVIDDTTLENTKVIFELLVNFSKNFVPWIRNIKQLNEDGTVAFTTADKGGFAEIIDTLSLGKEDSTLKDAIEKFIYGSRASVIGYKPSHCKSCDAVQPCKNEYIAWDPEQVFFEVAYRILERSITSIEE